MNSLTKIILPACLFLITIAGIAQEEKVENKTNTFSESLKLHLDAVVERNLETYMESISAESISMILPNGKLMANHEAIENFHAEWFEESGWEFKYKIIQQIEAEKMGYALLDVDYYNLDEQNIKDYRPFFLALVFQLKDGAWKLTHDQCTPNIAKKIAADSDAEGKSVDSSQKSK